MPLKRAGIHVRNSAGRTPSPQSGLALPSPPAPPVPPWIPTCNGRLPFDGDPTKALIFSVPRQDSDSKGVGVTDVVADGGE